MAKRRENAVADSITKKLKQVQKATSNGAKPRAKKKTDAGCNVSKEEKIDRKVKAKSNVSPKRAATGKKITAKTTKTATEPKESKYFQSPVKKEEVEDEAAYDSEDDFDIPTTGAPALSPKMEKDGEEDDSDEDEGDWEEVEELAGPLGPVEPPEPVLPSEPVEIEIETPEIRKRKKRQAEWETYMRRMVNRFKKDLLVDTHKVHLMCLIANGMFRNRLCSEPDLLAITLSLMPAQCSTVTKERVDQTYLSRLLQWFKTTFTLNTSLPCEESLSLDPRALLERRLASLSARNHQEMTHLFLLVLRSLQLFCRLVLSLQPIPLKLPPAKDKAAAAAAAAATPAKSNTKQETSKCSPSETKISPGNKRPSAGGKSKGDGGGKRAKKAEVKEEEAAKGPGGQRPKNSKRRSVASKVSYKEDSDSDGEQLSDEEFEAKSEEEDSTDSESEAKSRKQTAGKARGKQKVTAEKKRRSSGGKKSTQGDDQKSEDDDDDDDDDFEEERGVTRGGKAKPRNSKKREGPGLDEWLEVYLEKTSSWVCVDVEHGVALPHLCSRNATTPMTYVVSVDGDGFVKDLGRKYDPTWMTSSRKRRVDEEWWEETLEPFQGPEDERDRKEDKEMQKRLMDKPLPISVAEYKNHPLYALKRHLLKYEAIYPSTAAVLGYCRGEPVYSRDCVRTLHSKDTWLKEARTVRLGEEPYKMVKGFSNRSRKARMMSEMKDDNDLALFGEWQTEEYQPPLAVDGKVPRNDYGNVYLFKPCMLPVGCVHLQLPNLHRVARKLDIDAAPAVTGFDFHGGYSHAVTDGYIVCEEHEEILRTAWVEEQELQKQKEKEKREKRVISNWTLLVKGLLIREKLKQRYSKKQKEATGSLAQGQETGGLSSDEEAAEGGSPDEKSTAETLAMAWPQNRQTEQDDGSESGLKKKRMSKRERKGQEKHLFPFEKI